MRAVDDAYGNVLAVDAVEVMDATIESDPSELNVDVAVPPKYAFWKTESCVVDAPAENVWRAVNTLAAPVLAPEPPPPTHVPFTARHPPERFIPPANVEVAPVPVILR